VSIYSTCYFLEGNFYSRNLEFQFCRLIITLPECAVVDNSENEEESSAEADDVSTSDLCDDSSSDQDEAMSDSSYVPEDISDSDEDLKLHQKSKSKTKNEQTTRNHTKKVGEAFTLLSFT